MKKTLEEFKKNGASQKEMFALFDSLESIDIEFMYGKWTGYEIQSGSSMEGLLPASRWYGKAFFSENDVVPLIFSKNNGKLYYGNPKNIMLGSWVYSIPRSIVKVIFPLMYPFIKTSNYKARIRKTYYRGKSSASMLYDQLPIIDIFRKIDDDSVLGVMDSKQDKSNNSYFFVLTRVKKES